MAVCPGLFTKKLGNIVRRLSCLSRRGVACLRLVPLLGVPRPCGSNNCTMRSFGRMSPRVKAGRRLRGLAGRLEGHKVDLYLSIIVGRATSARR